MRLLAAHHEEVPRLASTGTWVGTLGSWVEQVHLQLAPAGGQTCKLETGDGRLETDDDGWFVLAGARQGGCRGHLGRSRGRKYYSAVLVGG